MELKCKQCIEQGLPGDHDPESLHWYAMMDEGIIGEADIKVKIEGDDEAKDTVF